MKIGEVAKIVGISNSAIRFYERHGLINASSIRREENGYRIYGRKELEEIQLIVNLKKIGLGLKEIKNLLGKESKTCVNLVASLDEQIEKCRETERLIQERISSLTVAKEACEYWCEPTRQVRKCCV